VSLSVTAEEPNDSPTEAVGMPIIVTPEEEELFERRYEEGYDLFDDKWLIMKHPTVPVHLNSIADCFAPCF